MRREVPNILKGYWKTYGVERSIFFLARIFFVVMFFILAIEIITKRASYGSY